jgi:hypothetical protein
MINWVTKKSAPKYSMKLRRGLRISFSLRGYKSSGSWNGRSNNRNTRNRLRMVWAIICMIRDVTRMPSIFGSWPQHTKMRYGTLYRNLGIAYWNTGRDGDKAQRMFIKALDVAPHDNRILYEYDQLRKKINDNPVDRLQFLESRKGGCAGTR